MVGKGSLIPVCNRTVLFLLGYASNVPDFTSLRQPLYVTAIRTSNYIQDMGHYSEMTGL